MDSIKDISMEWLNKKKDYIKQTSCSNYFKIIDKFPDEDKSINIIDNEYLQLIINENCKRGKKVKTIKDLLSIYKMILRYSWSKEYSNKFDFDLHYPKEYTISKVKKLSSSDSNILRNYLINNLTLKNYCILLCMATGLRIGEICALQVKDVNLNENTINIVKTITRTYCSDMEKTEVIITKPKTESSYRTVPLANFCKNIFKKNYIHNDEEDYLLSGSLKPIEPRNFRRYYDDLIKKLKIEKVNFHGLRHGFASNMIESGADVKTLSVILGHSNVTTTMDLYVHPSNKQKKNGVEKMWKSI